MTTYPKRLIEVDLPMARISAHARREKLINHGHISTLHIWWARRPLPVCRAVLCASLWPDPVDLARWTADCDSSEVGPGQIRPELFLAEARSRMRDWVAQHLAKASADSFSRMVAAQKDPTRLDDPQELRTLLLDFIADFANWDNSTDPDYLATARALTLAAHHGLGGQPGTKPLVVDPFSGGGAIPLEALRVGADAVASDLNPVAVLLNKVVLEYVPKHGRELADQVREWGQWIGAAAEKELADVYPRDPDGATPIVYLWGRRVQCTGPGCGLTYPLIKSLQFARKAPGWHYVLEEASAGDVEVRVQEGLSPTTGGTANLGKAVCPRLDCHHVMTAKEVRAQLATRHGGTKDAQLLAVGLATPSGRTFRNAKECDVTAVLRAQAKLDPTRVPSDLINPTRPYKNTRGLSAVTRSGMTTFGDLYTSRQLLCLQTYRKLLDRVADQLDDGDLRTATLTVLNCAVSRFVFQNCALSRWHAGLGKIEGAFGKQALQNTWDFAEANPLSRGPACWNNALTWVQKVVEANLVIDNAGRVTQHAAQDQFLPDDSADIVFTDPPYFASIPYGDLSDVFWVWERDFCQKYQPDLYRPGLTGKNEEIIVTDASETAAGGTKTPEFYQDELTRALIVSRRTLAPNGACVVVFADSRTESWEAILGALLDAGWQLTASWPLDTEMQTRTVASGSAVLQSSIHLVCRPRENPDGTLCEEVGEWRDVLSELPERIHEWMPRLSREGVAGADAVFACLGPALEIFSRYSRVEKASGERAQLPEYLEQVWAAVSKEALSMIFDDPDTTGLETDARLTAMWLWTLGGGEAGDDSGQSRDGKIDRDDSEISKPRGSVAGWTLEYDAARKIAQGLGIRLDKESSIVEVHGGTARLLPVTERGRHLFGSGADDSDASGKAKRADQLDLFAELQGSDAGVSGTAPVLAPSEVGRTVLDRVHQAMILFAAARGEALKRFLVEDGVGKRANFWKLAQALSALYPTGSDEKRWVDGVLARKKGLGL